jgi:solute carrier family 25 (mitochondrial phosphate transporter), member 3
MSKFVVYEKAAETIYSFYPKNQMSDAMQTVTNLGSGLTAGFAAAIVSQPADTMLSKINKTKGAPGEGTTSRLIKIAKELGLRGSYTGIGARLFMVGTLTAFQFAIYGDVSSPVFSSPTLEQRLTAPTAQEGVWRRRRCRDWQINQKSERVWLL